VREFDKKDLKELYRPQDGSSKGGNGQVVIVGGSSLFHGAPIFALKTAARICGMVFFASPEPSLEEVATKIKASLSSFIWVPWNEVTEYIKKVDAVLIGPGLMRYRKEGKVKKDEVGEQTRRITESFFKKFPDKRWVIDAGSLQVIKPEVLPSGAIITPNQKEYRMLFGDKKPEKAAKEYDLVIIFKADEIRVCSPDKSLVIKGGNAGLAKGGTGDVLAGLAVALAAKNEPFLAACAASFIAQKAAESLYKKVGFAYSADDLAEEIPKVLGEYYR